MEHVGRADVLKGNDMIYAPVVIPTLNRYEHLKQCLESLSRCTWADKTEVYVALDYPPQDKWDKYAPGWEKNRDWLHSVGDMGFKKLHLIERTENYGTWQPGDKGNAKCLVEDLTKQYDRYIYSEDDNVFSPNFLEFMDKGLEKFENDDKVDSLIGYRWYFPIKTKDNSFMRITTDYTPWGVGYWVKKRPCLDYLWFKKQLKLRTLFCLYRQYGPGIVGSLFEFARSAHKDEIMIDRHIRAYLMLTNKHTIVPTVSLVKNIGLDGSGFTMGSNDKSMQDLYDSIPMSIEEHFEFIGTGFEEYEYNNVLYLHEREWQGKRFYNKRMIKKILKYIFTR